MFANADSASNKAFACILLRRFVQWSHKQNGLCARLKETICTQDSSNCHTNTTKPKYSSLTPRAKLHS